MRACNYESAIGSFERAIGERARWWPEETREYHWTEDARDRYLLAMAHARLARESADCEFHEGKARAYYAEAEDLYLTRDPRFEAADLINRIRARAGEVLGIAQ